MSLPPSKDQDTFDLVTSVSNQNTEIQISKQDARSSAILQKPKLCLDEAELNRSKTAFIDLLRKQMDVKDSLLKDDNSFLLSMQTNSDIQNCLAEFKSKVDRDKSLVFGSLCELNFIIYINPIINFKENIFLTCKKLH